MKHCSAIANSSTLFLHHSYCKNLGLSVFRSLHYRSDDIFGQGIALDHGIVTIGLTIRRHLE